MLLSVPAARCAMSAAASNDVRFAMALPRGLTSLTRENNPNIQRAEHKDVRRKAGTAERRTQNTKYQHPHLVHFTSLCLITWDDLLVALKLGFHFVSVCRDSIQTPEKKQGFNNEANKDSRKE